MTIVWTTNDNVGEMSRLMSSSCKAGDGNARKSGMVPSQPGQPSLAGSDPTWSKLPEVANGQLLPVKGGSNQLIRSVPVFVEGRKGSSPIKTRITCDYLSK